MDNWVRDRGPESCTQIVALAEDFLLRHRENERLGAQTVATNLFATELPPSDPEQEHSLKQEEDEDTVSPTGDGKVSENEDEDNLLEDSEPEGASLGGDNWDICETGETSGSRQGSEGHKKRKDIHILPYDQRKKPYNCVACGKSFSQKSHLTTHKRIHTGEKSYICGECGKCFSHSSALEAYERSHTSDKPFICLDCGKNFHWRLGLSMHERTRMGEKLYLCTKCGKSFCECTDFGRHSCFNRMPRRKDISNALREAIVAAHATGKGYKAISKQFNVHHSTVRKIIQKWKTFKTVANLPRSGRPSKFTPRSDRAMLREIAKNPRVTSQALQASVSTLNVKVHDSTIRKRLNMLGRVVRRKPLLSK